MLKNVIFHIWNNTDADIDTDFEECKNTGYRYRVENIDTTSSILQIQLVFCKDFLMLLIRLNFLLHTYSVWKLFDFGE